MQTPTLEKTERIFSQSQGISQTTELVHFFEDRDGEALCIHGHGSCATAKSCTYDDHCKWLVSGWMRQIRTSETFQGFRHHSFAYDIRYVATMNLETREELPTVMKSGSVKHGNNYSI